MQMERGNAEYKPRSEGAVGSEEEILQVRPSGYQITAESRGRVMHKERELII